MTFGEKLKCARLALNISQSELSERTGISERSLYAYEKAGVIPVSYTHLFFLLQKKSSG